MSKQGCHSVTPLPAIHCEYYRMGHCLYEERLNPNAEPAWQCREVARFTKAYDFFLDQMEFVALSEKEAFALWGRRLEKMPPLGELCSDFVYSEASAQPLLFAEASLFAGVLVDCVYAAGLVCVLRLPLCNGACKHYCLSSYAETSLKKG